MLWFETRNFECKDIQFRIPESGLAERKRKRERRRRNKEVKKAGIKTRRNGTGKETKETGNKNRDQEGDNEKKRRKCPKKF